MNVFKSINKNLTELKKILNSQDIIFYKFFQGNRECVAVYVDSLTDKQLLGDLVIRSIQNLPSYSADEIAKNLANPECKTESPPAVTPLTKLVKITCFSKTIPVNK